MKIQLVLVVIIVGVVVESKMFVKEWFDKADLNQDSVLTYDEAKSSLLPKLSGFLGAVPVEERLQAVWNELDKNGDDVVVFSEFKNAAVKLFDAYAHKKDLGAILKQLKTVALK